MIPTIPNYKGYVEGPNGEELRTPLEQIGKNKDDITSIRDEIQQIQEGVLDIENEVTLNKVIIGTGATNADVTIAGGTTNK